VLKAQQTTQDQVEFLFKKAKFFDKFDAALNERQRKVLLRMFKEGVKGFEGGLSAENYLSITKTSRATATRDLRELVLMGVLTQTGELRYTRYFLSLTL
jgi:Fic family protein